MDQLSDFFSGLFSTNNWPPRWHCGTWSDFHGWLYIISNLLIWLAYFSIPTSLFLILNKKKLPFSNLLTLFILFILSCGATHLIDAIIFWAPMYRLNALILSFTAIISIITAAVLLKSIPRLLAYKGPEEMEKEIQQRKKIEDEYIKLNAELETKVEQRTVELKKSNEELEAFTSSVSHDLRSPILNMKELVIMLKGEKQTETGLMILDKLEQSANKASSLIQDLHDMSKNAQIDLEKQRIHTTYFLEKIIEEQKDINLIDKKTTIHLDTSDFLYGDSNLLRQVFINLISNAIKYKKPDKDPVIHICTKEKEDHVLVSVSDNGIGFDMSKKDYIFKIFKRLENKKEGTGIGLSIVKKIIEKHDGEIWAESDNTNGSTFYFKLPNK